MIVYIAGPITGVKNYKDDFARAEKMLKAEGHVVLNPAKLPEGMPYESYMPICFAMIDAADAVYMLSGWEDSAGANRELRYAIQKRKTVQS